MSVKDILPSGRFTAIVGSVALSALIICGAYVLTHEAPVSESSIASSNPANVSSDWKQTLENIQAQSPLNQLPQAPSQDNVNTLLNAATSNNVTDTVARTLLVNLSNAKAQGLGDDIPTQDSLVSDAVAQINQSNPAPLYTSSDLTLSSDTSSAVQAYGNAFMVAAAKHPKVNYNLTMYTVATSTDNNDPSRLAPLPGISADYAALARDLAAVPVPPSFAPLHLKIVNDFSQMGRTVTQMGTLYTDPLQALAGLQLYDALNQESYNLFISVAQEIKQNGILFNKDEPGYSWGSLAS